MPAVLLGRALPLRLSVTNFCVTSSRLATSYREKWAGGFAISASSRILDVSSDYSVASRRTVAWPHRLASCRRRTAKIEEKFHQVRIRRTENAHPAAVQGGDL